MYVNSGRVLAAVNIYKPNLTMEETFLNKRILKTPTRKGKSLTFYIGINKAKQDITGLKHLIAYSNLKMYINPKRVH